MYTSSRHAELYISCSVLSCHSSAIPVFVLWRHVELCVLCSLGTRFWAVHTALCCHIGLCRPLSLSLHCHVVFSGLYVLPCVMSRHVKLYLSRVVLCDIELCIPRLCSHILNLCVSLCMVRSCGAATYSCLFLIPTLQQVARIDSLKSAVSWRRGKVVRDASLNVNSVPLLPIDVQQEGNGCLCGGYGR